MSWRRFVDPNSDFSVSAAELSLACKLAETGHMRFKTQKPFCLLSTKPDFYFDDVNLAVYLDGEQIHKNRVEKDFELRRLLSKRYGCIIRVYSYKAPITKKRLQEITDLIVDDVEGLRRGI